MARGDSWFDFKDLSGGRNGWDSPLNLPASQVTEAMNIDYDGCDVARKRSGSSLLSLVGTALSVLVTSLIRHLPSAFPSAMELWAFDSLGLVSRLAGGTIWTDITPKDAPTAASTTQAVGVSFNGKLYLCYDSAQNRAQVWDGTRLRRVGLAPPSASPTAVTAAGTVTDNRKYYTSVVVKVGSTYSLRSELCQTPLSQALAAQKATVTLAGAPGENETHWELWVASDDDNYGTIHYVNEAAIGNTIEDNSATLTGVAPAPTGTYNLPPSAQFISADGDRLIFGGANETAASYGQTTPKTSRIWWTPRLGDRDVGDDERIINTVGSASIPAIRSYTDIDGGLTALFGPIAGGHFAFSFFRTYRLSPTGQITSPYRRIPVGVPFGCIFGKAVAIGEDEGGEEAFYFASHLGVHRIIQDGTIEFCGWDNQDLWANINLSATVPCHMVYHSDRHQLWVYLSQGSDAYPSVLLKFHTRKGRRELGKGVVGGWTRADGPSAAATCSTLFSSAPAASMGVKMVPYIGRSTGAFIWNADAPSVTHDAGTNFQAYIEKVLAPPIHADFRAGPGYLLAKAGTGVTLRQSLTADFGKQAAKTQDISLTPSGSETKIWKQIEDSALSGVEHAVTARLGDSAAVSNGWTVDQWKMAIDGEADQ